MPITIFAVRYPASQAFSFSIIEARHDPAKQSDYLMPYEFLRARLQELEVPNLHRIDTLYAAMQLGVHSTVTLPGVTMEHLVENSILGNNSYIITIKVKVNGKQKGSKRAEKILEEEASRNGAAEGGIVGSSES